MHTSILNYLGILFILDPLFQNDFTAQTKAFIEDGQVTQIDCLEFLDDPNLVITLKTIPETQKFQTEIFEQFKKLYTCTI
jgi:hypothetical protein